MSKEQFDRLTVAAAIAGLGAIALTLAAAAFQDWVIGAFAAVAIAVFLWNAVPWYREMLRP